MPRGLIGSAAFRLFAAQATGELYLHGGVPDARRAPPFS